MKEFGLPEVILCGGMGIVSVACGVTMVVMANMGMNPLPLMGLTGVSAGIAIGIPLADFIFKKFMYGKIR